MNTLEKYYGHMVRVLHWCTDQAITNELESMELTSAQGHMMSYLCHRESPPCPKDVEETLHLSHPTVSGLLSRLEKKGFIELRPDEKDRRCKRVYVLPKGRECHERMHQIILEIEEKLVADFTPEEKELFASFLERAVSSMCGGSVRCKHKEETTE